MSIHAFRVGAAATALVALAACAQPGLAPSQPFTGAAVRAAAAASPCRIAGFYDFHGACTQAVLPAAGGALRLAPYRGFALTLTFPQNDGGGKPTLLLGDATGSGDITGTVRGVPFSRYPKPCASRSCPGTAFLYIVRRSSTAFTATGKTALTIVNAGTYPGTTCFTVGLGPKGWMLSPHPSATPHGRTLTLVVAPRVNHVDVGLGAAGIVCK